MRKAGETYLRQARTPNGTPAAGSGAGSSGLVRSGSGAPYPLLTTMFSASFQVLLGTPRALYGTEGQRFESSRARSEKASLALPSLPASGRFLHYPLLRRASPLPLRGAGSPPSRVVSG